MADVRKLNDYLYVAPQLDADDVAQLDEAGFRSILCNRPDNESEGQPAYSEIQKQADALGMVIEFQPVDGAMISDDDVDQFAANVAALPAPVLAYCRSGTRCSVLWALSQAGLRETDEILATAQSAGYALEPLTARIEQRAASKK